MRHLRRRMTEDMKVRGYAPRTITGTFAAWGRSVSRARHISVTQIKRRSETAHPLITECDALQRSRQTDPRFLKRILMRCPRVETCRGVVRQQVSE